MTGLIETRYNELTLLVFPKVLPIKLNFYNLQCSMATRQLLQRISNLYFLVIYSVWMAQNCDTRRQTFQRSCDIFLNHFNIPLNLSDAK